MHVRDVDGVDPKDKKRRSSKGRRKSNIKLFSLMRVAVAVAKSLPDGLGAFPGSRRDSRFGLVHIIG
jgi:hypothetical protein